MKREVHEVHAQRKKQKSGNYTYEHFLKHGQ